MNRRFIYFALKSVCALFIISAVTLAQAQQMPVKPRQFPPGAINRAEDLPPGRLRTHIEKLAPGAKSRAVEHLRNFHFTELDLPSLEVDASGGVYYADEFPPAAESAGSDAIVSAASVPVSPFPASSIFHSKPGAANVIYLNFSGEIVTGTEWNTSLGRTEIPAVAFSTDADFTTFSDAEQTAIKRIWQRVAEDFAPFSVDVTTERPANFGTRTAQVLITRNTDATGSVNPSFTSGGVAYVDVFGSSGFASVRPAWIYFNNLSSVESFIAEAASHEIGHNLGLSHDGKTDGNSYYGGHGTGDTSWAPIMGTGYNRNVSQWSKGEYYLANNTQDDLLTISAKIPYRTDDAGDTMATAKALVLSGTNIISTTLDDDPANANPANKGILERNTDVDVFSFSTGTGPVSLTVNPWTIATGTRGGNVDLLLELRDSSGAVIITNNPASTTSAQIQTTLAQGTYYLFIRSVGVGDPFSATPEGYTSYGCAGEYFISGSVSSSNASAVPVQINVTANDPRFGSVSPASGIYPIGS
ncbi:MAG: M12 family metallo-peptidase, partial [Verrucomicrobiota bacterium]